MKKLFAIMSAVLALAACSKGELAEIEEQKQDNAVSNPVTFNITVDDMGTKALKTGWADGDVIYIKFKDIDTKFMKLTKSGANWNVQAYNDANPAVETTFEESDFSGAGTKKLAAAHIPGSVTAHIEGYSLKFEGEKSYYMYQNNKSYTLNGSTVTINLSLQKSSNVVLFHVPGITTDYQLKVTDASAPRCTSISTYDSPNVSGASYGKGLAHTGIADADGVLFSAQIQSGLGTDKDYTFTVIAPDNEYSITGNLNLTAGYQYSLPALNSGKWTPKFRPFSVSDTKHVTFSSGNLQYTKSTGTWSFMEHQYSTVETNADNYCSENYGDKDVVSLFGWATSGYDSKYPYLTSTNSYTYQEWGGNDIAGTNYDWGVFNSANIDGIAGHTTWRTLSKEEWEYLLHTRTVSNSLIDNKRFMSALIENTYYGAILFPDTYIHPDGTGLSIIGSNEYVTVPLDGWNKMENAGCIFLPAAGMRNGVNVTNKNSHGYYWSTTNKPDDSAWYVDIWHRYDHVAGSGWGGRFYGRSVRLVHDID